MRLYIVATTKNTLFKANLQKKKFSVCERSWVRNQKTKQTLKARPCLLRNNFNHQMYWSDLPGLLQLEMFIDQIYLSYLFLYKESMVKTLNYLWIVLLDLIVEIV